MLQIRKDLALVSIALNPGTYGKKAAVTYELWTTLPDLRSTADVPNCSSTTSLTIPAPRQPRLHLDLAHAGPEKLKSILRILANKQGGDEYLLTFM